ncbi:rab3 GTPase-activating protein catalytic subunit-like [Anoplophora glabripennis]|uniref:rab3 GTPase-activating protein catalytic subunit-like n=1 Tax=Anoplophora glabripennis TaxID=217634 RepID=UPI0008752233|nr:rab3 GTPase-activating protein catalytic subunit-like [Anoplophora glabripennis]
MNEEIDDSEFYHQDFTTASEWEIFIARLEEVINQWKTEDLKNEPAVETQNIWDIRNEKVSFADFDFILSLHRKKVETPDSSESSDVNEEKQNKNPIDSLYDFQLYDENNTTDASCLSTWYGINEFIVLSPFNNVGVTSESKIKILLSSAYVVASNLNCEVPIFVQIREKWQRCFLGVYEGDGIRTNFEMVHLKRGPPHCQYLTGLLDLFKTKIMSPCTIDDILVSVQQSYTLTDFGNFIWKQDFLSGDNFDVEILFILPFGVTIDPIKALILKATWNHFSEHLLIGSENYSDFDPMVAPKWSCTTKITNEPLCLLGECLSEFLQNLNNNSTVFDVLGDFTAVSVPENNPLDVLTEPSVPNISGLLSRAARSSLGFNRKGTQPITDSVFVSLLYFLFPDADESSNFPYGGKDEREPSEKRNQENVLFKNLDDEFKGFKTCIVDSLTWRLSIVLAHALQSLGGIRAFAHVWYEFVQEMRYRWEKSMPIPG